MSLTKKDIQKLPRDKLYKLKHVLKKYFYNAGTNIALRSAFNDQKSQEFKDKIKRSLLKQINHIAKEDSISQIVAVKKITDRNLVVAAGLYWMAFEDSFPGGNAGVLAFLLYAANQGGQSALDKMIPPPHNFKLENLELQMFLKDRLDFLKKTLDSTSIEWVATTIQKGLQMNLSTAEIVSFLKKEAENMAVDRSDLITETELAVVMSKIESETFKRNTIVQFIWHTSEDERVCTEICMKNDLKKVGIGENFPSGHDLPPAHLRCRCFTIPVLPTVIEQKIWRGK